MAKAVLAVVAALDDMQSHVGKYEPRLSRHIAITRRKPGG
jgi:hypothetical protein